ncbi:hypothetical protein QYE76_019793 [Lolium multiflorum]|uniref:F-box domain-containing protein n=1 Tax=Lolium multiflorum TaxID=4521 RepID=A0AAD8R563_LOLMU|nr:hypothetical protein QYE76_019793 [Lolium multiflorum]
MTPAPTHRPPKRRRHLVSLNHAAATGCAPAPTEATTTNIAMMPQDLTFEILSRVPVRSACRFSCVSKRWCALISDPSDYPIFLVEHKSLHNQSLITENPGGRRNLLLMDMKGNIARVTKGVGGMGLLSCILADHLGFHVINPTTGVVLAGSRQHLETRYCKRQLWIWLWPCRHI